MPAALIDISRGVPRPWIRAVRVARLQITGLAPGSTGAQGVEVELDTAQIKAAGWTPEAVGAALVIQAYTVSAGARTVFGSAIPAADIKNFDGKGRFWKAAFTMNSGLSATTSYLFDVEARLSTAVLSKDQTAYVSADAVDPASVLFSVITGS